MAVDETETEMEYINMAVDNSMLDDYSLYVYLADSDAEWAIDNFNRLKKEWKSWLFY